MVTLGYDTQAYTKETLPEQKLHFQLNDLLKKYQSFNLFKNDKTGYYTSTKYNSNNDNHRYSNINEKLYCNA